MAKHYDWNSSYPTNIPEIQEHSLVKHQLLEFYLERYIKVLTSNPTYPKLKLWLIDGFAGGGLYRIANTNKEHYGSPFILLRTVDKMRSNIRETREKYFNIEAKYFFVEKDKPTHDFLKQTLIREGYKDSLDKDITLINGSFLDVLPDINEKITTQRGKKHRCIFILDQYGYTGVPINTLKTIFSLYRGTTEVIMTFATEHLIQYMSKERSFKMAMESAGLEKIVTDKWIENLHRTDSYEKKSARLLIEQQLATEIFNSSGANFFTPFFIKSKTSGRSFLIIHLSSHLKARDEMSKIQWKLHNCFHNYDISPHHYGSAGLKNFQDNAKIITMLGYDPFHDESQSHLFEYNFDVDAEKKTYDALEREIPEKIFDTRENMTVGHLITENCNHTPASIDQFKKTLEKFIETKELEITSSDGKHKRLKATTIKNDDIISLKQRTLFGSFF